MKLGMWRSIASGMMAGAFAGVALGSEGLWVYGYIAAFIGGNAFVIGTARYE